jgi:anti-sigma regulatory factor (Ser/Thr protein kinase)
VPSLDPVALALPFAASSASIARTQLKEWLQDLGQPTDVIEDSRLVVSELVGNAVRHARPLDDGTVIVAWKPAESGLDIAVTDGGAQTEPHAVDAAASDLAGRGLTIVQELSSRWWLETSRSRSTVHALVEMY